MFTTNHFKQRLEERKKNIEKIKRLVPVDGRNYRLKKQNKEYKACAYCENSTMIVRVKKSGLLGITIY